MTRSEIRQLALDRGAALFGVAPVERFSEAPKGFHPQDIYAKTRSVIVFAVALPTEAMFADNPVPYTHVNALAMQKTDLLTFDLSVQLERAGIKNVLVPTDDPYLHWDEKRQHGQAILSLRHAAELAGLGRLGRNNLLINKQYGNMIQIGALLSATEIEPDPLADYEVCPPRCRICLDNCPEQALTGERVIQERCRPLALYKTERGFTLKKCFECRKKRPHALGLRG